jgi:SLEI family protein
MFNYKSNKTKRIITCLVLGSFVAGLSFMTPVEAKNKDAKLGKLQGQQLYAQGLESINKGDLKTSAAAFMEAAKKDPKNPLYELLAADMLRLMKQYPSSIRYYEDAIEHIGKADKKLRKQIKAKALIGVAESCAGANDEEKALKYADQAINEYPNDYRGHYIKGIVYANNPSETSQAKAIEEYKKAIEVDKTQYNPYVKLIKLYNKQGKIDDVIKTYKQAVNYRPIDEAMKMSLVQLYISETKKDGSSKNYYPEAIEELKSLIAINERNYYAHYYLSTINLLQGNREECFKELAIVNSLNPNLGSKLSREIEAYVRTHGTDKNVETTIKVDEKTGNTVISVNGTKKQEINGQVEDEITLEKDKVKEEDRKSGKENSLVSEQVKRLERHVSDASSDSSKSGQKKFEGKTGKSSKSSGSYIGAPEEATKKDDSKDVMDPETAKAIQEMADAIRKDTGSATTMVENKK